MKKHVSVASALRRSFIWIDSMLFSLLLYGALQGLFGSKKRVLKGLLLLGILSAVFLTAAYRERQRKAAEKKAKRKKELLEKALLLSDAELSDLLHTERFVLIRKADPDMFDITDAIRNGPSAIGIAQMNPQTKELIEKYRPEIRVIDFDTVIETLFPEESVTANENVSEPKIGINKYLLLGLILLGLSFILRYKLYFRILSYVCMTLAMLSAVFRNRQNRFTVFSKMFRK